MKFIRTLLISLIAVATSATFALADPALYEFSDGDTQIYALGTFHLLPPGAVWRSEAINEALAASDAIYFEADVWSIDPAVMQSVVIRHGIYPQGDTLSAHLSAEEWQQTMQYAASLGLPPEALQTMRPWMAAVTLVTVVAMTRGYDPEAGVDASLFAELTAQGRELRFFEDFNQQIGFLAGLSEDVQMQMLMETVTSPQESADQFDIMYAAWVSGDLDQLDALGNGAMREQYVEAYEAIIVDRNRRWVDELSKLMQQPGTYFVAVGALHLPGTEGIAQLMADEGFVVERR